MSYDELRKLSTTPGSEFGRVITYCVQDCEAVRRIDDTLQISDKKLLMVTKCNIPLSMAINNTNAQCITSYLQQMYRDQGYSVPYNTAECNLPKFKGAFTAVDKKGLSDPDVPALQIDFLSMYPSSILQLNISAETFSSKAPSTESKYVHITDEVGDDGEIKEETHYYVTPSKTASVLPSVVRSWKAERVKGKTLAN